MFFHQVISCGFGYLCIAGFLAASASIDTAKQENKFTVPCAARSLISNRGNLAVSGVKSTPKLASFDDEDRSKFTLTTFAKMIGANVYDSVMRDVKSRDFEIFINNKMALKSVYDFLGLSNKKDSLFAHKEWYRWAFFVCQLGYLFEEDAHEFIIEAMSVVYDAETLSTILASAIEEDENPFVMKLLHSTSGPMRSLLAKKLPGFIKVESSHQVQRAADMARNARRKRLFKYLKKQKNIFSTKQLMIWTNYLSTLYKMNDANDTVGTELQFLREYFVDFTLVSQLLLLQTDQPLDNHIYLTMLMSMWVNEERPPSDVVNMLMLGKTKVDCFPNLFVDKSPKRLWMRYFEMYNEKSHHSQEMTDAANLDLDQLLKILHEVAVQLLSPANIDMAISTILQVLTSPSIAHLWMRRQHSEYMLEEMLASGILPSKVVSLLVLDKAQVDFFSILFLNESSKNFWVQYLEKYFERSNGNIVLTQIVNEDFERLLAHLLEVVESAPDLTTRNMAISTLLDLKT